MINVFKPSITEREIQAVAETLRSGWIGLGPKTAAFEAAFAEFTQVPHAIGVSSATAALDLALRVLDLGPGDEVIIPTVTFVSTGHVVVWNQATPVFADVDAATLNIDLEDVRRKITDRTRAIIPVHYAGRPVDIPALRAIAGDIPIIEDCAHATGASLGGQPVGSLGDLGCFSFHAVKNLAMGDGGAVTCRDSEWAERLRRLRWLGIDKGTWDRTAKGSSYWWQYSVDEVGYKCHMNDIGATIGLIQLERLPQMNQRRREIVAQYRQGLADLEWLRCPPPDDDTATSSWHIFCIQCDDREGLAAALREQEIATGVHYYPIHKYSCYQCKEVLPTAEAVFPKILTLPVYPDLTDDDVQLVICAIREFQPSGA